ncbi:MAG: BlaI/MecI/CopY family transcriptional regulator [Gammaproteobacteria bacterium]|nr:BlaI/MecI/CopY family transcriptional regulator [Gammaproteobacteria bacterium]MDH5628993.1 BlaI/MecI/CopY family transcriptional regulator [Gammaproteobacteria bacterium]
MIISDSEKYIMDVLWRGSVKTAKEIVSELEADTNWHEKTIKTLINRLLKKKAIGYEKQGREYRYFAILKEDDYIAQATDSFLQKVFKGDVSSLVAAFAKKEKLSSEEIEELKEIIRGLEK